MWDPFEEEDDDLATGFTSESVVVEVYPFTERFNLASLIEKVRSADKLFRSPTRKNDSLDPILMERNGQILCLKLDCRTRWDSTACMLERFLEVKKNNCLQHALLDAKSSIMFNDDELKLLRVVTDSLRMVRITTKTICKRNATHS